MNIVVLNINANSGKTTVAKNLLLPRLPVEYVAIESICDNADIHKNDNRVKPEDYLCLQEKLVAEENLLVDIGSSNIEQFFYHFQKISGRMSDFHYIIIPLTGDIKCYIETESTLVKLLELKVNKKNIRLVLNKSKMDDAHLLQEFSDVMLLADNFGIRRPKKALKDNPIYSNLRANHLDLQQVLKAIEQNSFEHNEKLPKLDVYKQPALAAKKNLDDVFKDLEITCK